MGFIPEYCSAKTPLDHVLKALGSEEVPADWRSYFNLAGSYTHLRDSHNTPHPQGNGEEIQEEKIKILVLR